MDNTIVAQVEAALAGKTTVTAGLNFKKVADIAQAISQFLSTGKRGDVLIGNSPWAQCATAAEAGEIDTISFLILEENAADSRSKGYCNYAMGFKKGKVVIDPLAKMAGKPDYSKLATQHTVDYGNGWSMVVVDTFNIGQDRLAAFAPSRMSACISNASTLGYERFAGFTINVERRKGEMRSGVDPQGNAWENEMKCHYGEFISSLACDGDRVDCYLGSNQACSHAYIVHQAVKDDWNEHDEDKVMLGFNSLQEATAMYLQHYNDDERFMLGVTTVTLPELKSILTQSVTTGATSTNQSRS